MFGHAFFGARMYGPRYYGPAGVVTGIAGPWFITLAIDEDTSGAVLVRQEGDRAAIKATFRDIDGDRLDPDTVTMWATSPAGVTTVLTVTRQTVGEYRADCDLTEPGRWFFRVLGTGLSRAAEEGLIMVEPGAFVVAP